MNKNISDFSDIIKDQILKLRKLEGTEIDTDISVLNTATGSMGVSGTAKAIIKSIGSAFIFHHPNPEHSQFNSPKALLGPWTGGSTVLNF